jgi:hypothetical protein
MASLISTLARWLFARAPEVVCERTVWREGVAELARRAGRHRESGAFLLGTKGSPRRVEAFAFYDDIDPGSLNTGIVRIDGRRLGALWSLCRETKRSVVADVHVHPGRFRQSQSDQDNPVIAEIGHFAVILPDFAAKATNPGCIGVFQYLGSRNWSDRSDERPSPLHIGWWPTWR